MLICVYKLLVYTLYKTVVVRVIILYGIVKTLVCIRDGLVFCHECRPV